VSLFYVDKHAGAVIARAIADGRECAASFGRVSGWWILEVRL
jgi:hypothetical protein